MASKNIPSLKGKRFTRLEVLEFAGINVRRQRTWKCKCDCGNETVVPTGSLHSGSTKSCGCLQKEVGRTHGMSRNGTPEYIIWASILHRCGAISKGSGHKNYEGRGITVCNEWKKFENFFADMGSRPSPKHSIDRVDNNKGYYPDNCRWATKTEQDRNRRTNKLVTYDGHTRCVTEWAEIYGLHPMVIFYRLEQGWSVEKAITTPSRAKK